MPRARAAASGLLFAGLLGGCAPDEAAYYARLGEDLREAGLMRVETAPADAAFTNADLVRDFEVIALFSEYGREDGRFVQRREPTLLSKWVDPIRMRLVFGPGVAADRAAADRAAIGSFAARLATITGLDIGVLPPGAEGNANFIVILADRAERRHIAAEIERTNGDADPAFLDSLGNSPLAEICYVNTFWKQDEPGRFAFAVTVIKDETRGLMRLSCLHEELTQALGLGNDDDGVRPSIFNDDEEFALLTEHDEYLLRMLYDPALRPGMTVAEVRPLLPGIVARIRPEGEPAVAPASTLSPPAPR